MCPIRAEVRRVPRRRVSGSPEPETEREAQENPHHSGLLPKPATSCHI